MTKTPSKTSIKKILSECAFDPRNPGPMKAITDIRKTSFYRDRAIELINNGTIDSARQAIQLLALVINYEQG
jgi:hypothetical protein